MSTLVPTQVPGPKLVTGVARCALLAMVAALAAVESPPSVALWLVALSCIGVTVALVPTDAPGAAWFAPIIECVVVSAGVLATGGTSSPLLPYLIVPALAAGVHGRRVVLGAVLGSAEVIFLAGFTHQPDPVKFMVVASAWALLGTAVGGVAWWARVLLKHLQRRPDQAYLSAYRLLGQLRAVVRHLPAGLDTGATAERLLAALRSGMATTHAGVWIRGDRDRLICVAEQGQVRQWQLEGHSAVRDALLSGDPETVYDLPGAPDAVLVLPLVTGARVTGLIALATARPGWTSEQLRRAEHIVGDSAVRLESALLFDDIRRLATTEERHRLAREVHDGVAQDLVFLGYGLDNVLALLDPVDPAAEDVRALRGQVTRVVRDLRMSLYDLRSDLGAHGGLGEALGEQVREAGRQGGLRVHLELSEVGARLLPDTEAELLRIAQEAIANARKHSSAENLWVTCEVDPPSVTMRIRDDGRGLAAAGSGYGRSIMAERAARIGAQLTVGTTAGGGTEVLVRLGTADHTPARRESDAVPGAAG